MNDRLLAPARAAFFERRPVRVGSLLVTLFGDMIEPRGGSVWLGSVLALTDAVGIDGALVRTAMSRLTASGWVERRRIGRNAFYRLSGSAAAQSRAAGPLIYAAAEPDGPADFTAALLLEGDATARTVSRERLAALGFQALAPNLLVTTGSTAGDVPDALFARLIPETEDSARALASRAFRLDEQLAMRKAFVAAFGPIAASPLDGGFASEEAVVLRLLVIHEWRRLALRAGRLPARLAPQDRGWSEARASARRLWLLSRNASEAWLDREGRSETGALPPADRDAQTRFA